MRSINRKVTAMSDKELRQERQLRLAWIRDATGLNRSRIASIDEEIGRRRAEGQAA